MHRAHSFSALLTAAVLFAPWPAGASAPSNALSAWFESGRCAKFDALSGVEPPFARNDSEHIESLHRFAAIRETNGKSAYYYDAQHRIAFRSLTVEQGYGTETLRSVSVRRPTAQFKPI